MSDQTPATRRTLRTVARHPSAVLLAAQLVVVLAYPFLVDSVAGRAVVGVFQMVVVLSAVAAVRNTPALVWVAVLLGGPAMLLSVAEAASPETGWIVLASAVFHVPFYFFVSYAMIRYLFHDDRVTRDELFATGAAFTVVAWGFAYLYAAAQVIWPAFRRLQLPRRRPRGPAGVVRAALPVVHDAHERRSLRRLPRQRPRPVAGDARADQRGVLRRAGGGAPDRADPARRPAADVLIGCWVA